MCEWSLELISECQAEQIGFIQYGEKSQGSQSQQDEAFLSSGHCWTCKFKNFDLKASNIFTCLILEACDLCGLPMEADIKDEKRIYGHHLLPSSGWSVDWGRCAIKKLKNVKPERKVEADSQRVCESVSVLVFLTAPNNRNPHLDFWRDIQTKYYVKGSLPLPQEEL